MDKRYARKLFSYFSTVVLLIGIGTYVYNVHQHNNAEHQQIASQGRAMRKDTKRHNAEMNRLKHGSIPARYRGSWLYKPVHSTNDGPAVVLHVAPSNVIFSSYYTAFSQHYIKNRLKKRYHLGKHKSRRAELRLAKQIDGVGNSLDRRYRRYDKLQVNFIVLKAKREGSSLLLRGRYTAKRVPKAFKKNKMFKHTKTLRLQFDGRKLIHVGNSTISMKRVPNVKNENVINSYGGRPNQDAYGSSDEK